MSQDMIQVYYPARMISSDGGAILVTFRDVPEAITGAPTEAEALVNANDALCVALKGYILDGRPLPAPSSAEPDESMIQITLA